MIIWVTKSGIDYNSVLKMSYPELQRWHESALEFHEYRLNELSEIFGGQQGIQNNRRNIDPSKDFF